MCIYCITPLAKGLCDTPLVLLTLKFHDLHPFLIYTPTPSVYAHPNFNCVTNCRLIQVSLASHTLLAKNKAEGSGDRACMFRSIPLVYRRGNILHVYLLKYVDVSSGSKGCRTCNGEST